MVERQPHYEIALANYCDRDGAIALLKQYRPYLEMVPSMRRPLASLITLPLPIVRLRGSASGGNSGGVTVTAGEAIALPCDLCILMCDPEWQVKTGVEILVFIHRPGEDFSDLLRRWRLTQMLLDRGYEWLLPARYEHMLGEAGDQPLPLFVVFPETPDRIQRGLQGAGLPFVVQSMEDLMADENCLEAFSTQSFEKEE